MVEFTEFDRARAALSRRVQVLWAFGFAKAKYGRPAVLKELIEAGKVKPVVDRTCSLSEVPGAIRCLEEGHARGKAVITV